MISVLRFLMWLALVVWMGGLIFFSFVLAPTVFTVLPTRHLAGNVVSRSLSALHWMGLFSAIVFLVCSWVYTRLETGSGHPFAPRHVLVFVMMILTAISQFAISPKMAGLRNAMGMIDNVSLDNPLRVQFDALHVWSTRLEGTVFFLGLLVIYLVARRTEAG